MAVYCERICTYKLLGILFILPTAIIANGDTLTDQIGSRNGNWLQTSNLTPGINKYSKDYQGFQNLLETLGTVDRCPKDKISLRHGNMKLANESMAASADESSENKNKTTSEAPKIYACLRRSNISEVPSVRLVNGSQLPELLAQTNEGTKRIIPSPCTVVLFYIKTCRFCAAAAPHFNALARAFPDIDFLAIDAVENHSYNMMFGVIAVPNVIFFHNGLYSERYNESEYTLTSFSIFLMRITDITPQILLNVTSADFYGPVPSVITQETDIWLVLSWCFIVICFAYFIQRTATWKRIVDCIYATWNEAVAQHEHIE